MRRLRRQYRDLVGERARAADVGGLLDLGLRWAGTALAPRRPGSRARPTLGTLVVTYRCDLRCRVCDLPRHAAARRARGVGELGTDALVAVLRDMRHLGAAGVGITGGEPMLRPDLPALIAAGRRIGLHVHLNTDGFAVAQRAEELRRAGVRSVNVSLDGADAAEHDAARGRPGAFEQAIGALGALRRARRGRTPRITAVAALSGRNLAAVRRIARVALEAGADRLGVIPVHDFGRGTREAEARGAREGVAALRELHAAGRLDNSLAYLDLLPRALRGEASPLVCYAPWASVVVDCYGDVFPCFPLMERREPVGRIPLVPLWRSRRYEAVRRRLAGCRACYWNCHAEMNLTLPQPRGARSP